MRRLLPHILVPACWSLIGGAVAVGLYLLSALTIRLDAGLGPAGHLLLTVNGLINPSVFLGMTKYYEVSMGSYSTSQVIDLALFNMPIYAAFGWTQWMGRRGFRVFEALAILMSAPFLISGTWLFLSGF